MLIVDTGPLVAAADEDDPDHHRCVELLESAPGPLVTTGLVIAEGRLVVEALTIPDWVRVRELVERYADMGLGVTDASVIALAEHHGTEDIATLDRRHFHVVRPAHRDAFTLLP